MVRHKMVAGDETTSSPSLPSASPILFFLRVSAWFADGSGAQMPFLFDCASLLTTMPWNSRFCAAPGRSGEDGERPDLGGVLNYQGKMFRGSWVSDAEGWCLLGGVAIRWILRSEELIKFQCNVRKCREINRGLCRYVSRKINLLKSIC